MSKLKKSKIDFKEPTKDAYDSPRTPLSRMFLDEAGQFARLEPNFDFQDAIKKARAKGRPVELILSKPKKK